MADPVSIGMAAKAAIAVLTDEKPRKTVGWIIAAVLSPIIIIAVLICILLSGISTHNNSALELSLNPFLPIGNVPAGYRQHIEDMRNSFALIDVAVTAANLTAEEGNSLDLVRVKAVFYSLYFGEETPSLINQVRFVDCFYTTEERVKTVEKANGVTEEEKYTVNVAVKDTALIYANIASIMGKSISTEDQANASEVYFRVLYGKPAPTYGQEFDDWSNGLAVSNVPFIGVDGFCSPLGEDWRKTATSEFGYRIDPFTRQTRMHNGIDLSAPIGTPVRAALPGVAYVVRYSKTGYGYHVMLDHGGGFVTLYAHCSKLYVTEGQYVDAGSIIAEVGSTGRSTGPHLHFEVRVNGEKKNPRRYLP